MLWELSFSAMQKEVLRYCNMFYASHWRYTFPEYLENSGS